MKKLITVFGPGQAASGEALYEDALLLGRLLAERGFIVVNGGYDGVMEAVSKGAREAGGSVVGVIAEVYYARGREANPYLTREVKVKSAVDRTMELLDLADAYVAIGNSTGTFVEVMTAWDFMVKRFIPQKPMLLVGESWKRLQLYFNDEQQFQPFFHLIRFCSSALEAVAILEKTYGNQSNLPELDIIAP